MLDPWIPVPNPLRRGRSPCPTTIPRWGQTPKVVSPQRTLREEDVCTEQVMETIRFVNRNICVCVVKHLAPIDILC